jgi:hypothetical protein
MTLPAVDEFGWLARSELPGESIGKKLTDELKSFLRSCEASHASKESMDHPFPYIEASIDSCRDCACDKPDGIIQQHFVIAHVHADRD